MFKVVVFSIFIAVAGFAFDINFPWLTRSPANRVSTTITDNPTFYSSMGLGNTMPSGGALIFLVFPKCPLDVGVDPLFSGSVIPEAIMGPGATGVAFTNIMTTDTLSSIPINDGMGIALLRATGEGYFSVRVRDSFGIIKPSLPSLFKVVPSGTVATRWAIFGPEIIRPEDQFAMFWAAVVDDDGLIVPDYYPGFSMDVIYVRIVGESHDDSSAWLESIFDRTPARELLLPIIWGMFPFFVRNTESEIVQIIASGVTDPFDPSEVFSVEVVPEERASTLIAMNFDGLRINTGQTSNLAALAFASEGPDFSNSSTKTRLSVVDLSGTHSATITPSGWVTLSGGVAGFSLTDTEPDSMCIFIVPEIDSTPRLSAPIWTPIQVVRNDKAVRFNIDCPGIAIVGDTVKLVISAVNYRGEIDPTADVYFTVPIYGDDDPNATIIDSATGESWTVFESEYTLLHMTEGRYVLKILDTESEYLYIKVLDAEITGLFDQGYIASSWSEHELRFESGSVGGAISYQIERVGMGLFPLGEEVSIDVSARTETGEIDLSFFGSAVITSTGSVEIIEPAGGILNFNRGIASFKIIDHTSERVSLEVSGVLYSDRWDILFMSRTEGGIPFPFDVPEWIPIGCERTIHIIMMGFSGIVTTYNGWLYIDVHDPNDNGSVIVPDSVRVTSGVASLPIRNRDAEFASFHVSCETPEMSSDFSIITRAQLIAFMPLSPRAGGSPDTVRFAVTDTAFSPYSFDGEIELSVTESNPNSSITFPNRIDIVGGYGIALFENSEAETITVFVTIPEDQFLFMRDEPIDYWTYKAGMLVFEPSGISEVSIPKNFTIEAIAPNPFNSALSMRVFLPASGDLIIELFDINGREILKKQLKKHASGWNNINLDFSDNPSGIYFVRASWKNETITRKAVLLR